MPDLLAPWSDEQVETLNRFQAGGWFHPFTCGGEHESHVNLVATNDGWVCPDPECGYTQKWAHPFMADKQWVDDQEARFQDFFHLDSSALGAWQKPDEPS